MSHRESTIEIASVRGGAVLFRLLNRQGQYVGNPYSTLNFDIDALPPLDSTANLTLYGSQLKSALSVDQDVNHELVEIFHTVPPDSASLEFAIAESSGELFRWEALHDELERFLALRGPCSLKRTAYAGASRGSRVRLFAHPIRMIAFLSASGINSEGEFDAILVAIENAQKLGLEIETTIYLGQQSLLDKASKEIATGLHKGLSVKAMPKDAVAIEQALTERSLQVVHFGCHGRVDAGVQLLEFATINDHDIDADTGSVSLSIDRLTAALQSASSVWLTVLNSCSGAQAVPRLSSMAHALAKNASPVVIGMAEPIYDQDAQLFAKSFYLRALEVVAQLVNGLSVGERVAIDLGPAVSHARAVLSATHPDLPSERHGRWCLPILCQRDGGLTVARVGDWEMAKRIELVAGSLRGFPTATPEDLRRQILDLLNREPPAPLALRPDLYGNLN
ncbi:CHAT domain-containing protein [Variovorax paradoxus]|nr:CHAT domain-containing protein [Variovorax paradoxus]MBT2305004.1 CHAT domain-containing protein [Variovorax paradoxus]